VCPPARKAAAVGTLSYPARGELPVSIDDRTLAHVQFVIGSKLRMKQGFFFTWAEHIDTGSGRGSIWIDSSIPLLFVFATSQRHLLNRTWLESLMASANSAQGLTLTSEPEAVAAAA